MRFAIAGFDRYIGVFEAFVQAGWQPLRLFTLPCAGPVDSNARMIGLARQHHAALQLTRMTEADLQDLGEQGCDALIVASYPWRIGDWRRHLSYGVNFHCSPLPDARGPYPLHRAILEARDRWSVACHRLDAAFDTGDVLATEDIAMQADESHERLDLKIQMASKRLARRVAGHFVDLWQGAQPQGPGHYWPRSTSRERVLDFGAPVEEIGRRIRAFGETESLALISGTWIGVRRALCWPEPHPHPPGQVVHIHDRTIVVSALDGYVAITEGGLASPDLVSGLGPERDDRGRRLPPAA